MILTMDISYRCTAPIDSEPASPSQQPQEPTITRRAVDVSSNPEHMVVDQFLDQFLLATDALGLTAHKCNLAQLFQPQ